MTKTTSDPLWSDKVSIIWDTDRLTEFWPSKYQSFNEKVNAICRFLAYTGILLAMAKNDSIYIVISLALIVFVTILGKTAKQPKSKTSYMLKQWFPEVANGIARECQKPTQDNPFANRQLTDKGTRDPACYVDDVAQDTRDIYKSGMPVDATDPYMRNNGFRQFYSMPNTQIPNNQEAFAKWCYNPGETCKSNPKSCTGFENSRGSVSSAN